MEYLHQDKTEKMWMIFIQNISYFYHKKDEKFEAFHDDSTR